MATPNENLVYANFMVLPVENAKKTREAGRPIYDDVEHVEIRFAANKKTIHVAPAHEVFRTEKNLVTGIPRPVTYAMEYNDQYKKFKAGVAQDQSGTPLSELPFLTASKRLELKALNIHTAETLAAIDGPPLKQLGMGGRELKNQAQAYLDNAKGNVDVGKLAARIAALEEENAKLRGGTTSEAQAEPVNPNSPFADMEDQDIRNWIEESGGSKPRSNATRASLIKQADELNASLAKKAQAA